MNYTLKSEQNVRKQCAFHSVTSCILAQCISLGVASRLLSVALNFLNIEIKCPNNVEYR